MRRAVVLVGLVVGLIAGPVIAAPESTASAVEAAPSPASAGEAAEGGPATGLRELVDFADPSAWTLSATDDVQATLRAGSTPAGRPALCLDIDFGRVTGYVGLRHRLPIDLPPRYEFELGLRGDGPPNDVQFKLDDGAGGNVWWARRLETRLPVEGATWRFRQRQIAFAWGPAADRSLHHADAVEFVIASGRGGGRLDVCLDRLALRTLPPVAPPVPPPRLDAEGLQVDFGVLREFRALALRWQGGAGPAAYAVDLSHDGEHWREVLRIDGAWGGAAVHLLAESEARFVRVRPLGPGRRRAALASIEPLMAASADAVVTELARAAPRGLYPRAYRGEQPYWTVFGVDGAPVASLLGEDGAVEPLPGVGSLEPYLVADGRVLGWADARITQRLRDDALPMPSVGWRLGDLALEIEAFGAGRPEAAQALVRYTVRNLSARERTVALALAWRPFQVNPPTQFLAHPGGAVEIAALGWDGQALRVDGQVRLRPLEPPAEVRIEPFAAGPVGRWLADHGAWTNGHDPLRRDDAERLPSAALRYPLTLAPGGSRTLAVVMPVTGEPVVPRADTVDAEAGRVAAAWHGRLDRVRLRGPGEVDAMARDVRAALGHILVNRSGPALQPGARAYARSWIRDGALTSSALLRLGHAREAREFITWFAGFQFGNGKVPCCVGARGADPVPEHDSDGEFAFAVAELFRYTHDTATGRRLWPTMRGAIAHLESLRQSERAERNRGPERAAFFGLLPPSISHEGYSDRPAYSYWDDFWAAIGYRSAAELAAALGERDDAARIAAQGREFEADLLRSIDASTRHHGLDLLPGSADRGDVDPTSSTIALSPGGLGEALPKPLVAATFQRWWRDFQGRRADEAAGVRHGDGAYTPYEWRNVGALVRLGERERARAAIRYFRADRRPAGWHQWAEVVARDPREPRFLGDMPHGWVASDQIRAVLDLFAYEDEGTRGLVLAAGVTLDDLAGAGVAVDGLQTPWGPLAWQARMQRSGGRGSVAFVWPGLAHAPPGGIRLRGPWPADARVSIDGRPVDSGPAGIALGTRPARLRVAWPLR